MATKEKKETLTFDVSKLKFQDLNGQELPIPTAHKSLGNSIYLGVVSLDGLDLAQRIHKGGKVEITPFEKEVIIAHLNDQQCSLFGFVKKTIIDYLNTLK